MPPSPYQDWPFALLCTVADGSDYAYLPLVYIYDDGIDFEAQYNNAYGQSAYFYADGSSDPGGACEEDGTNISEWQHVDFAGGSGSTSPYIIDVGSTLMLGAILAFFIAHWIVGLARNKSNS